MTASVVPITGEARSFVRWTARFNVAAGHDPAARWKRSVA